jgi:hypothetical protein
MTSTPHVDVEELKRQMRKEVLWDERPILEASGIQFFDICGAMSNEEHKSSLASTTAGGGPSIEPDMIDNLSQPTACNLILLVGEIIWIKVMRGLVYPRQTMFDDVQISTSSYVVGMVDMVHDNSKDLKLELPPDDMMLTMWDAVTRRVQWRQTSIDIDPSAAASTSTSPSQSNTSPASMSPKACPSPIWDQPCLSLIRDQLRLSLIPEQLHLPPIQISCKSLQLKSSRVALHLRLRVPHSLHLIRCRQRQQRMYVARVIRSCGRCPPRQQRARNQWKSQKLTQSYW